MYLYEKAFGGTQFDFGYAAAIAWCMFLMIAVVAFVNYTFVRKIRSAES
jgi:cellobiose transport system permease protein